MKENGRENKFVLDFLRDIIKNDISGWFILADSFKVESDNAFYFDYKINVHQNVQINHIHHYALQDTWLLFRLSAHFAANYPTSQSPCSL